MSPPKQLCAVLCSYVVCCEWAVPSFRLTAVVYVLVYFVHIYTIQVYSITDPISSACFSLDNNQMICLIYFPQFFFLRLHDMFGSKWENKENTHKKRCRMKTSADSSTVECSQRELRNNNKRWLPFFTYMNRMAFFIYWITLTRQHRRIKFNNNSRRYRFLDSLSRWSVQVVFFFKQVTANHLDLE